ncbi:hypothetical protein AB3S75_047477 [Citrus x aurantiifolia]
MEFEPDNVFSVPQDIPCYMQPEWMCGFHFGNGLDVIEEDALNEKYCIQVLRILITKADTEIDELEKDLVFLQSELAWAEYDDWFETCCKALTQKLDCFSLMVWTLKNRDKNDVDVRLLIHRKPAKKIHEIVKDLLNDCFQEKDKQTLDVVALDSSVPPEHAAEPLDESIKLSQSDSFVPIKEEIQECCITPTENGATLNASLMLQENKSNHSETIKLTNGNAEDSNSSPDCLTLEAGHAAYKKIMSSFDLKSASMGETKEPGFTTKDKNVIQNLSLKTADKRRHNLDMIKVQPGNAIDRDPDSNACRHETDLDKEITTMWKSGLKVGRDDEVSINHTITTGGIKILEASSNPEGKGNPPKVDKPTNAILQNICDGALSHSTGLSGRRNNLDSRFATSRQARGDKSFDGLKQMSGFYPSRNNSDSRLAVFGQEKCGNSDVNPNTSQHATDAGRCNSDSVLATLYDLEVGNGDASPASLRHTAGLNQRRNHSDSNLNAVRQAKGEFCDVNQKLCDFAQKAARKRRIKESKLTLTGKIDSLSSSSSSGAEGNRKPFEKTVKVERVSPTYNEHSALPSLLGLQDKERREATKAPFEQIVKVERVSLADNENFALPSLLELQDEEGRDKMKAPFEKIVEFERASPSGNEHSALPSFLEHQDKEERDRTKVPFDNIVKVERASPTDNQHSLLQDEEGRDTTKAEPDKGSMQSGEAQVVETATNDEKFDLYSMQPQKQKAKRKIESNPPSVQEREGFLSIELVSNSSIISKAKRQLKSGLGSDIPSSNQFMGRKIVKKIVYHHQIEANEPNGALDDRQISVSLPKKKIKKKTSLPILEMDLSKSHRDPNDSAGKDDLSITDSHSIESCTEAVASSPFTSSHLRNMKLGDLRNFAKKLNIKPYSKLRKDDLIEHIANHLGCR